jgi:hypothetical protein
LYSENIWKIQKKIIKREGKYGRKLSKLNSDKIGKIWKKRKLNGEMK